MATKDKVPKDKSSKKKRAAEEVPVVETVTAVTVETTAEPASPAVKRKAEIEELEVNLDAPEPPSKRARRALKKGKSLPAKAASDDDDDLQDKDDEEEEGGKKKERSEHGVWIGNLPFLVSGAGLKKWLVDNSGGTIEMDKITRVKVPKKKDPSRSKDSNLMAPNKGFAYVDFEDLATKIAAVALSEAELGGRKLLIKDSTSFEGRPKKEPEPEAEAAEVDKKLQNASRKIFVGNMGFKTTEDDLRHNFDKCGEIEWAKLATFEDSGKCKGFGWVRFKEPEAAAWAVKGFVKIKEAIETEEDFQSDSETSEDEEKNEKKKKNKQEEKKFKTRKWWVNRLMGRELKIELAEDDQTRYKKRFTGKKGMKPEGEEGADRGGARGPRREREKPRGGATDMDVARLKGTVVEHTGSKVSFD